MKPEIVPVTTSRQLDEFVEFSLRLFKNDPCYVPELVSDTKNILNPRKNVCYEFCSAQPFLALHGKRVVGRVVAIINPHIDQAWKTNDVRFGWFDFIEDYDVFEALLDAVVEWGKERGKSRLHGPLGFTDFDREGLLVEGFDQMSTMSLPHAFPYYLGFYERYGLEKSIDWKEFKIHLPLKDEVKIAHLAEMIQTRYSYKVVLARNSRELREKYGYQVVKLLDTCYEPIYGYAHMTEAQIKQIMNDYLGFLDLKLFPMIFTEDGLLVGVGVLMPSIAKAIKKAGGKLFPFGWFHILKSLMGIGNDTLECLLMGVHPEHRNTGVHCLIFNYLQPILTKRGYKYMETNACLETNNRILAVWDQFNYEQHKRRRVFHKDI